MIIPYLGNDEHGAVIAYIVRLHLHAAWQKIEKPLDAGRKRDGHTQSHYRPPYVSFQAKTLMQFMT